MTPERWQQIKRLFHEALSHQAAQRSAFLAKACAGDVSLRHKIEALLESHEQADDFIETPASDIAAALLAEEHSGLAPGEMVGPFTITNALATGGMGQVYLAQDTRLRRSVALKLLPPQFTVDRDRVRRFEQEARAASALNHPNIVTIHEIGQTDSLHYIATEFVDGETLREHLRNAQMTVGEVLDVAGQIASALQAAHEAGIVHRDIKPENIMLRRDRIVKVLDFGLAKLALEDQEATIKSTVNTNPGVVMGTVAYMSPEQARGNEVDARTDIWSLGVVLYEMVARRAPFKGDTPSHVIVSILENKPPSLSADSGVPAELERIISKSLRKDPVERYQAASDMALDLKNLKEDLTIETRLKQLKGSPDSDEKIDGQAAFATASASAVRTSELSGAHSVSSAEYLLNGIKHYRGTAVFASIAGLLLIASLVYLMNFPRGSNEAIDSVAVLPFVNAGGQPENDYLAEGLSDSVINSLARLHNLRVISLNAVLPYKGQNVDPKRVGRELNVRAVLVGRVMRQGDDLAISTELVDVRDNSRLWGDQYNRKSSDMLALQAEIARQISSGLRLRLSGEEQKQLAKQDTENNEAYQLYILGRHYFHKQTKEGYEKSVEYYEKAVKADPNYALAYLELGRTYHWMGTRGFWPTKESEQKSERALLTALELDDTLAYAHARLGVLKFSSFDWTGAEKQLKRALELDPNSSEVNRAYFQYLAAIGRPEEGLQYAIRANEADSTSGGPGGLGFAYLLARQYDKSIQLFRVWLEKNPDNAHAHILLGETYAAKGKHKESVAAMEKGVTMDATLEKTPERWDRYPMLAYAYAAAGRRSDALKILAAQKELAKQRYVSPYNFAIIYTGLGDMDHAFEWLEKCIEERTRLVYRLKVRPMFDPLRSDPRYSELLRRMNLEP